MLFTEKDISSKRAPSNGSITMTSIEEEAERKREGGKLQNRRGKYYLLFTFD